MTISDGGWVRHSVWDHSTTLRALYRARARDEVEEMTCAAQAAELLAPLVGPGEKLLDAGCGSGYFYHSLRRRLLDVDYWGIDASPSLVEIGREELARFGLAAGRLQLLRIEDVDGSADHVVCMNVLSNLDSYHRPLERLLKVAQRSLILRESLGSGSSYNYVRDDYLDDGVDLRVHVNRYDLEDVLAFIRSYGYTARHVIDRRTGGQPDLVIGYPHWWAFVVAERQAA